jgi:hypothetical protein
MSGERIRQYALKSGIPILILDTSQEAEAVEIPKSGWKILVEGLTEKDAEKLTERVKCALVFVLPERVRPEQVIISHTPKAGAEAEV